VSQLEFVPNLKFGPFYRYATRLEVLHQKPGVTCL
jgi:hypothetical protein